MKGGHEWSVWEVEGDDLWVKEISAVALDCGVKTCSSTENEAFSFIIIFFSASCLYWFIGSLGFEDRWKAEEESKEYRTLGVGWARRLRKLNALFYFILFATMPFIFFHFSNMPLHFLIFTAHLPHSYPNHLITIGCLG